VAVAQSEFTGPRAYFDRALTAFHSAAHGAGVETRHIAVGGHAIQLNFAGRALLTTMYPALAHREVSPRQPHLVVRLWDSESTGGVMPPPYWALDAYAERGEIRAFDGSGVRAAFSVDGPTLECLDQDAAHGMFWTRSAVRLPAHERAAPLRRILCSWLGQLGLQVIHAGAVAGPDGCVLLAGAGGAGKSNTALSCLAAGMGYLADDYCVLGGETPPIAHSLYSSAKVRPSDLTRLRGLDGLAEPLKSGEEKLLLFLDARYRDRLVPASPIRAIVLPHVRLGGRTALAPASPGEVAKSIAISTIAQIPHAGVEVLRSVARLCRHVQAFDLSLGDDASERAPVLLRDLAAGVPGAADA
jgi:hypothetical protein